MSPLYWKTGDKPHFSKMCKPNEAPQCVKIVANVNQCFQENHTCLTDGFGTGHV